MEGTSREQIFQTLSTKLKVLRYSGPQIVLKLAAPMPQTRSYHSTMCGYKLKMGKSSLHYRRFLRIARVIPASVPGF